MMFLRVVIILSDAQCDDVIIESAAASAQRKRRVVVGLASDWLASYEKTDQFSVTEAFPRFSHVVGLVGSPIGLLS